MISLPNGCSRSEIIIIPDNWDFDPQKARLQKVSEKSIKETERELLSKEWRVVYRFYDPTYKGTKLWGKQFPAKGMNKYKTLAGRQEFTKTTFEELSALLDQEGYNPITKKFVLPEGTEIDSNTLFPAALKEAHKKLKCAQGTKDDIERALVHIQQAIMDLKFNRIPVKEIAIRNVILLLERIRQNKYKKRDADLVLLDTDYKARKVPLKVYKRERKKLERYSFGASSFNHYRSYLIMLFKVIVPLANMSGNPVKDIAKEKEIKKIRDVLTDEQRKLVNDYLYKNHYEYWRFLQIFFHSGARITEILRIEPAHVDLKNQRYKALILKGNSYQEVWKVIKNLALPYWQEALEEACKLNTNGQPVYLFSKNQRPGLTIINEEQISRRWFERVKHKPELGNVTADFYALKHLNSTETRTIAGAQAAAAQNSHKSEAMVVNIYDVQRDQRKLEEMEQLKHVNNPFA